MSQNKNKKTKNKNIRKPKANRKYKMFTNMVSIVIINFTCQLDWATKVYTFGHIFF